MFWKAKFERNVERDASTIRKLSKLGWRCLVVWECELRDEAKVTKAISAFLVSGSARGRRPAKLGVRRPKSYRK